MIEKKEISYTSNELDDLNRELVAAKTKLNFMGAPDLPKQKIVIGKNCKVVRITQEEDSKNHVTTTTYYYSAKIKTIRGGYNFGNLLIKTERKYYLGVMPIGDDTAAELVDDMLEKWETEKVIYERAYAGKLQNYWEAIVGKDVSKENADPELVKQYELQTQYLNTYETDLIRISEQIVKARIEKEKIGGDK